MDYRVRDNLIVTLNRRSKAGSYVVNVFNEYEPGKITSITLGIVRQEHTGWWFAQRATGADDYSRHALLREAAQWFFGAAETYSRRFAAEREAKRQAKRQAEV